MRIPIGVLLLPLLLLSHRSSAGSFDHGSVGAESKPPDRVTGESRLREERSNQRTHFERSVANWTFTSSRADSCPDAAAIAPCICTVDSASNIDLDCTFVESEEQLSAVFQQEFPAKELHEFFMANNSKITVLGNILNGVTFESIDLSPGPFVLEQVTDYFISDSRDTLTSLRIYDSQLTSDLFPFEILSQMEVLEDFRIYDSSLSWIPPITAPKISGLHLCYGLTDIIEAGTFSIHEWQTTLYLYFNQIVTIEPGSFFYSDENSAASSRSLIIDLSNNPLQSLQAGTFPLRNSRVVLRFTYNEIAFIEPGTFFFPEATSAASSETLIIDLSYCQLQSLQAGTFPLRNALVTLWFSVNQIAFIEPGTFVLPEETGSFQLDLTLRNNQLTTFDEAVFGDLMPFIISLTMYDNPFSCGCDIAWLVLNSEYMMLVDEWTTCANGTRLLGLNPEFYSDSC